MDYSASDEVAMGGGGRDVLASFESTIDGRGHVTHGGRSRSSGIAFVVEALNASVDLLLVAFDGSQFYRSFGCV